MDIATLRCNRTHYKNRLAGRMTHLCFSSCPALRTISYSRRRSAARWSSSRLYSPSTPFHSTFNSSSRRSMARWSISKLGQTMFGIEWWKEIRRPHRIPSLSEESFSPRELRTRLQMLEGNATVLLKPVDALLDLQEHQDKTELQVSRERLEKTERMELLELLTRS